MDKRSYAHSLSLGNFSVKVLVGEHLSVFGVMV